MCQVMGFLMRRRLGSRAEAGIPKLGPPDLGFPTAGVGVSLPCPEGEQARRMVARRPSYLLITKELNCKLNVDIINEH